MTAKHLSAIGDYLPAWVPPAARHYLVHTETGTSIRALARASDCHPSTVLRQVRKLEYRRDDLLIDGALRALSVQASAHSLQELAAMPADRPAQMRTITPALTQNRINQEAVHILRRLCEHGAVLAAARDMETAVVVRQNPQGDHLRTSSVDRDIAQAMALKEWIACADPEARVARYFITSMGRAALRRLTAQQENRAGGFVDRSGADAADGQWDLAALADDDAHAKAQATSESPLVGLARRRDRDGTPFLSRDLVRAVERLREDFELARLAGADDADWHMAAVGPFPALRSGAAPAASAAHGRLDNALRDLGPGLGDVVLRCCCLLEGLEQTEKTLGWSARSGKIVLRIALARLGRHYAQTQGRYAPLIG